MNLHRMLYERAADGRPLRVGLIGAGKFAAMYIAQIPNTPGVHLAGIADLAPDRARANLERVGWKAEVSRVADGMEVGDDAFLGGFVVIRSDD